MSPSVRAAEQPSALRLALQDEQIAFKVAGFDILGDLAQAPQPRIDVAVCGPVTEVPPLGAPEGDDDVTEIEMAQLLAAGEIGHRAELSVAEICLASEFAPAEANVAAKDRIAKADTGEVPRARRLEPVLDPASSRRGIGALNPMKRWNLTEQLPELVFRPSVELRPIAEGGALEPRPNAEGGALEPRPIAEGGALEPRPNAEGGALEPRPIAEGGALEQRPIAEGGALEQRPIAEGGAAEPRHIAEGGALEPRPIAEGGALEPRPIAEHEAREGNASVPCVCEIDAAEVWRLVEERQVVEAEAACKLPAILLDERLDGIQLESFGGRRVHSSPLPVIPGHRASPGKAQIRLRVLRIIGLRALVCGRIAHRSQCLQ